MIQKAAEKSPFLRPRLACDGLIEFSEPTQRVVLCKRCLGWLGEYLYLIKRNTRLTLTIPSFAGLQQQLSLIRLTIR